MKALALETVAMARGSLTHGSSVKMMSRYLEVEVK